MPAACRRGRRDRFARRRPDSFPAPGLDAAPIFSTFFIIGFSLQGVDPFLLKCFDGLTIQPVPEGTSNNLRTIQSKRLSGLVYLQKRFFVDRDLYIFHYIDI